VAVGGGGPRDGRAGLQPAARLPEADQAAGAARRHRARRGAQRPHQGGPRAAHARPRARGPRPRARPAGAAGRDRRPLPRRRRRRGRGPRGRGRRGRRGLGAGRRGREEPRRRRRPRRGLHRRPAAPPVARRPRRRRRHRRQRRAAPRRRRRPVRRRAPDPDGLPPPPAARAGGAPRRRAGAAEPQVHLRHLRHRRVEPLRPRRRVRRGRGPREGLQPPVRLRRLRAGQDPPAARDRRVRPAPVRRGEGALRELGGVHQRLHQLDPRRQGGGLPAPLPRRRRAAHRRHPVPVEQGADPGGVLPHLQHPAQRREAGRDHLRPAAEAAVGLRGAHAQPLRVGPDHRHQPARPRDPHRHPAQEGGRRGAAGPGRRAGVHRLEDLDQHPRARGRADPGHRLREPQPGRRRHAAGRGGAEGPGQRRRDGRRVGGDDHGADRRLLRAHDRGPVRGVPLADARPRPPGRDVPVPQPDPAVPAEDRPGLRRARPHHGDARQQEDPRPDDQRPDGLHRGQRADEPDQGVAAGRDV
ncbi:MAG: Chromosomal replication initiator protein DnaA, partial [uncultured Quadrisphaera sp.]